jgi:glycosyltransferase involved in cell wall biosynthesis
MIRLLLLLDARADLQTRRACETLAARLGTGFDISTRRIGRGGDFSNVATAALALRKLAPAVDLVHAFGMTALSAAALSPLRHICFTPDIFPRRSHIGWLRAILHYRDINIIASSFTMHRALGERGIPLDRCHLIRPGIDFSRIKRRSPALRKELGFLDQHYVLLAPGESTRQANHRLAVWASAILNVMNHHTRLLLWGRGPLAEHNRRFAVSMHQPELVTLATEGLNRPVEFEELLGAADAIVIPASDPIPTLPVAMCMASALPIIATVTPTVSELLEDRHTALMTQPDNPRLLAQRILAVRSDARLQWGIADMARTEAYEYFSQTRFVEQHRIAYRAASAGMKVEIPEQAAGAGLRFHGRG